MSTTPTTYGTERDRLAHALATLLAADEPALGRAETPQILAYRDIVLTNLTTITQEILGGAAGAKPTLGATAAAPARVLGATLRSLPRAGDRVAPTDLFSAAARTPYARGWRTTAQAAMLAADALTAGEPKSWRADPDTGWSVMADTSAAAHALAILDRRLATHPTPRLSDSAREVLQASWRTGLRLVASEVTRLAHTQPLSNGADQLARPPELRPFPVTEPAQLAAGYQQVLRLLQASDGRLPIRTLGHLTVAQARIAHTLADHCHRAHTAGIIGTPNAGELARAWRRHAQAAERLAEHRRAVTGLHPGSDHPVLAQAGEVLRAVQRLPAQHRHQLAATVTAAGPLQPLAARVEHTLAHGITTSFARDLYLVANENLTRHRHSLCWISARHTTEEHPLLAAARDLQSTRPPQQASPTAPAQPCTTTPTRRRELQQALRSHEPTRSGPPAINLR
jgi:hypothetical protein